MYIKCVLLGVRFVETDFCQIFMFYEMFLCKVRSGRWPSRTVGIWGLVEFASEDEATLQLLVWKFKGKSETLKIRVKNAAFLLLAGFVIIGGQRLATPKVVK